MEGIGKSFKPETRILSLLLNSRRVFKNYKYFLVLKSTMILEHVFMTLLPMRYNSVRLEIKVVRISGNVLLFKNIKISLGLLITVREPLALFRENHCLEMSTAANNRIRGFHLTTAIALEFVSSIVCTTPPAKLISLIVLK